MAPESSSDIPVLRTYIYWKDEKIDTSYILKCCLGMNETQTNSQSIKLSEQFINKNLSEDVWVAHNDQEGLSPTDCNIEPLWVAKEA